MGESANASGRRVLVVDEMGIAWSVPIEWTDLVEQEAEIEVNAGRAFVLLDDLLALGGLIRRVAR